MESGVILVVGLPGACKTSSVVSEIVNNYMTYNNKRYRAFMAHLKQKNKFREVPLSEPPQKHVVSANFSIRKKFPNMTEYPISGFELGKPNGFMKIKRLIKYGVYVLDEAYLYYPSKQNATLPPWVTDMFNLRRHLLILFYLIVPSHLMVHPDIRKTVDEFRLMIKAVHTYKKNGKTFKTSDYLPFGRLIKSKFYGVRFKTEGELERYLKGDTSVGEKFVSHHNGDIRDNYDPYNFDEDLEETGYDYDYGEVYHNKKPREWTTYKKAMKELEEAADEVT